MIPEWFENWFNSQGEDVQRFEVSDLWEAFQDSDERYLGEDADGPAYISFVYVDDSDGWSEEEFQIDWSFFKDPMLVGDEKEEANDTMKKLLEETPSNQRSGVGDYREPVTVGDERRRFPRRQPTRNGTIPGDDDWTVPDSDKEPRGRNPRTSAPQPEQLGNEYLVDIPDELVSISESGLGHKFIDDLYMEGTRGISRGFGKAMDVIERMRAESGFSDSSFHERAGDYTRLDYGVEANKVLASAESRNETVKTRAKDVLSNLEQMNLNIKSTVGQYNAQDVLTQQKLGWLKESLKDYRDITNKQISNINDQKKNAFWGDLISGGLGIAGSVAAGNPLPFIGWMGSQFGGKP